MITSKNGRALIERYEGIILQSYDDAGDHLISAGQTARGTLTIGYGHTSAAGAPTVYAGMKITKMQADDILASDLKKVEADVNRFVKVKLNQNQFDALVSFHFNTGSLGRSTLLRVLNTGDYKSAADHFMDYTRGRVNGQLVQMNGLIRRRNEEKALFLKTSDNLSGPVASTVAGGGILYSMWDHIHSHPYISAIVATVVAALVWDVVHYLRNKK